MTEIPTTEAETIDVSEGTTVEEPLYNEKKLTMLSTWASVISWITLVFYVLVFGRNLYYFYQSVQTGFEMSILNLMSILDLLYPLLIGLFYFILLQAVSEGIYLLLDKKAK